MSNQYYFGIEGGGTHSSLIITDKNGNAMALSEAGSTNIYSVPKEEAFDNLSSLVDKALETSGIKKTDLTAGCIGSAGLAREGDQTLFREFFDIILGPEFPVKLCSDAEILLCGGLESLEGYCLIAGTGSIALGRSRDGKLVRAGGHGYMLGDEGSAAWLGKTAIARTLRSLENRDIATDMLKAILQTTGFRQSGDLVYYIHYAADKKKVASLAPIVTEAASKGDPLAQDILRTGAVELALLVKSVMGQSPWICNKELLLSGGVLTNFQPLANELKEILKGELPDLTVSAPKGSALQGASMLAINLGSNPG